MGLCWWLHIWGSFLWSAVLCLVAHSCLTLCDPMDYSLPGSTVCGIFQARTLKWVPCASPVDLPNSGTEPMSPILWANSILTKPPGQLKNTGVGRVAYPFSRGSSQPRNQPGVSCIAGGFFTSWATRGAPYRVEGGSQIWNPPNFWHQGSVSWKTIFPPNGGGQRWGDGSGSNVSDREWQMKLCSLPVDHLHCSQSPYLYQPVAWEFWTPALQDQLPWPGFLPLFLQHALPDLRMVLSVCSQLRVRKQVKWH